MGSVNAVAKPLFESHSDLLFTKLYLEGPDEECKAEFIQRYQNKSWWGNQRDFFKGGGRVKGVGGDAPVTGYVFLNILLKDGTSHRLKFWIVPNFDGPILISLKGLKEMRTRIHTHENHA
eukprot:g46527.t1